MTTYVTYGKIGYVMADTEQNTNKIPAGTNLDPRVHAAITKIATDDDRSISNTIERLLKKAPEVQEILESETAAATV